MSLNTSVQILESFAALLILTTLPLERAASIDALEKHICKNTPCERAPAPKDALARALALARGSKQDGNVPRGHGWPKARSKQDQLIIVTGSFVLAGAVRAELRNLFAL